MCQLLLSLGNSNRLAGSSILELGCGAGAVGVFGAALGASRVVMTDGGESECALAELNARRHKYLYQPGSSVSSCQYLWGEPVDELLADGSFDWVLGADIIYSDAALPPLCDVFSALIERSPPGTPRIVLAHQRNRAGEGALPRTLALVAAGRSLTVRPFETTADI
eukprot:6753206-Prymnesium_polylepis.1